MISRAKVTSKMKLTEDKIAQHTGDALTPTNVERLVRLNLQNTTSKRKELMQRLEKQLQSQNNVKALMTSINLRQKRSWLWMQIGLTPGNKLRYIQALSGTRN